MLSVGFGAEERSLHILIATPGGGYGKGGIDRMMASVRSYFTTYPVVPITLTLSASRGSGPGWLSPLYLMRFVLFMAYLRLNGRCDLVHVNLSSRGSGTRKAIICRCAAVLGIPYIVHLHGSGYDEYWRTASGRVQRKLRHVFRHAEAVIVLGSTWARFIAAENLAPVTKVVVLPNATHAAGKQARSGNDTVQIVFTGRLGVRKGTPELVRALGSLPRDGQWRAVLAGDGDVRETKASIAELSLETKVRVEEWLDSSEVAQLLSSSDIFALPSHAENLPMSVIEAMAHNLAVVATPVGATTDIVKHGETGLIVEPGDIEGLASALRQLIEDANLRRKLGDAAGQFHQDNLNINKYISTLISIWESAHLGEPVNEIGVPNTEGISLSYTACPTRS